jgi:flagellar protein FliS
MTSYSNARQAYTTSSVLTASPGQLIVMAYDGAIRALRQSADAMRRGDRERARNRMRSAEAIIDELNNSLDMSHGEIPARLRALYLYCKRLLINANTQSEAEAIDVAVGLLTKLRESWFQIAQTAQNAEQESA